MIELAIESAGLNASYDITDKVSGAIDFDPDGAGDGLVSLFAHGSTIALVVMRYEPGTIQDLLRALDTLAPDNISYLHGLTTGDPNGFSHIRSTLLGTSINVPWRDGALALSPLHRIVLIDFDLAPATRRVFVDYKLVKKAVRA